ncbi:MAG: hypothetical protein MJ153_06635 [Clostridia bacterium]|nr:hypothetical protein [Clostridia bacterium]
MKRLKRMFLRKNIIPAIAIAVFLVLLSLGSGYYFLGKDTMNYLFWSSDIKDMTGLDFEEGKFVKFEAEDILGVYAEYEDGDAYVIEYENSDGDTEYIGMFYSGSDQSKPVDFAENGKGTFKERGMLCAMTNLEEMYYREFFELSGFDKEVTANLNPFYIVCVPFKDIVDVYFVGGVFMMLVFIIGAVCVIISAIRNSNPKLIKSFADSHGVTADEVAEDVLNGETYADVMIGSKYALLYKKADNAVLIAYSDIDNMYRVVNKQVNNNGTVYVHTVCLKQKDGIVKKINVDGEKAAKELMNKIQVRAPYIVINER